MHNISISLFITIDGDDYYYSGIATKFPKKPSTPSRDGWKDFIDVPTQTIKEIKPMAKVITLPTCKLLGG